MTGDRPSPVPLFSWKALILAACLLVPGTQALAQTIIPPPPKLKGAPGQPDHRAIQNQKEPWLAYDFTNNQNLRWLCDQNTWVDAQTEAPLGFDGVRGANGEIIPPPPIVHDASGLHQATQNQDNPARATDSRTGKDFSWDARNKTWRDSRTGDAAGFDGWLVRKCGVRDDLGAVDLAGMNASAEDFNQRVFVSIDYQWRTFYKWKEVSGNSPSVVTNAVTSVTNGIGGWTGIKLSRFPIYGMAGSYYAAGLNTDAILLNKHRVHNAVKDYGFGAGLRLMPGGTQSFSPWLTIAGLYQVNNSVHTEFDKSDALLFSETRKHRAFAGEYGVGGTFWVQPTIGLDFGASYNGQFKNVNADENVKLSAGLIMRMGFQ